jgi:8-oxo-dGTP pyrophosphatase MutT (NUDIX family)
MHRDIHKSAGIIFKNKKILVEKDIDKEYFISPGGKLEEGETSKQALVRELNEELKIDVEEINLEKFGHFDAPASGQEERMVHMDVFVVNKFSGKIQKGHKVEKLLWINSNPPKNVKIGSIFEHEVLPRLKNKKLID